MIKSEARFWVSSPGNSLTTILSNTPIVSLEGYLRTAEGSDANDNLLTGTIRAWHCTRDTKLSALKFYRAIKFQEVKVYVNLSAYFLKHMQDRLIICTNPDENCYPIYNQINLKNEIIEILALPSKTGEKKAIYKSVHIKIQMHGKPKTKRILNSNISWF